MFEKIICLIWSFLEVLKLVSIYGWENPIYSLILNLARKNLQLKSEKLRYSMQKTKIFKWKRELRKYRRHYLRLACECLGVISKTDNSKLLLNLWRHLYKFLVSISILKTNFHRLRSMPKSDFSNFGRGYFLQFLRDTFDTGFEIKCLQKRKEKKKQKSRRVILYRYPMEKYF